MEAGMELAIGTGKAPGLKSLFTSVLRPKVGPVKVGEGRFRPSQKEKSTDPLTLAKTALEHQGLWKEGYGIKLNPAAVSGKPPEVQILDQEGQLVGSYDFSDLAQAEQSRMRFETKIKPKLIENIAYVLKKT